MRPIRTVAMLENAVAHTWDHMPRARLLACSESERVEDGIDAQPERHDGCNSQEGLTASSE